MSQPITQPQFGLLPLLPRLHGFLLVPGRLPEYEVLLNRTPTLCPHLAVSLQLLSLSLLGHLLHRRPESILPCALPPGRSMVARYGPITGLLLQPRPLRHHRSFQTPPAPLTMTRGRLPTVSIPLFPSLEAHGLYHIVTMMYTYPLTEDRCI